MLYAYYAFMQIMPFSMQPITTKPTQTMLYEPNYAPYFFMILYDFI